MELREERSLIEDAPLDTPSQPDLRLIDDEDQAAYCRWANEGGNNLDD
jgi:hypothetical protein